MQSYGSFYLVLVFNFILQFTDKNGYKDVVHKIPFPEQIPEKQYVTMYLTVRFDVYSMKTGALVFTSEDARDRLDDSNFNGLFTRIVECFFKNLKSEIN